MVISMNIFKRWNNAWVDDINYHTNLGHTPPIEDWEEEQKRRRKSLEDDSAISDRIQRT